MRQYAPRSPHVVRGDRATAGEVFCVRAVSSVRQRRQRDLPQPALCDLAVLANHQAVGAAHEVQPEGVSGPRMPQSWGAVVALW